MVRITLSIESGFSMRSKAPIFVAFTAISILPCPEINITGINGLSFFMAFSVSIPSIPCIQISSNTISGESDSTIFNASYPLAAVVTSKPSSARIPLKDWRMEASSSTINTDGNILKNLSRLNADIIDRQLYHKFCTTRIIVLNLDHSEMIRYN